MGVTQRADAQRGIPVALGQFAAQSFSCRGHCIAIQPVPDQVHGVVQRVLDLRPPRARFGQNGHRLAQHLEVVVERLDVGPAHGDPRILDDTVLLHDAEEIVTAGVRPHLDRLAALRAVGQRQHALAGHAQPLVELGGDIGQPAHRLAAFVDHAQFAVDVEQQHDFLADRAGRDCAGEAEPGGVEQLAPCITDAELEWLAHGALGKRHGLFRAPRRDCQRRNDGVNAVAQALQRDVQVLVGIGNKIRHVR